MKLNVSIDMDDFYGEFENLDEWLKEEVRTELRKEVMGELKKDPRWKEHIQNQIESALSGVGEKENPK